MEESLGFGTEQMRYKFEYELAVMKCLLLALPKNFDMSHFAYACKMRYPINLVLETWEYLWFY